MGIKNIKVNQSEIISSVPGTSTSKSLVFSKLLESTLFDTTT